MLVKLTSSTGKKTPWPQVRKYKKVVDKATKKNVRFTSSGTTKNYLGFKGKQKYDFYLGGTDSCQGRKINNKRRFQMLNLSGRNREEIMIDHNELKLVK
jgi:hypothetical protein